jgi:hypothetical protein
MVSSGTWVGWRSVILVTLAKAEAAAAIDNDYTQKKSVILTMNSSWEVLAEVDMENNAVNVESSSTVDSEHSKVFLCWRPDGTLCAISSVDASDSMRKIRIYERETAG